MSRPRVDVVVLTGSQPDMAGLLRLIGPTVEWTSSPGTICHLAELDCKSGPLTVAAAEIEPTGDQAASVCQELITELDPQYLLLVGGVDGLSGIDVKVGDVLSARKIYGYAHGIVGESFKPTPELGRSSYRLEQRAMAESRKLDWLKRLDYDLTCEEPPRVVLAALAAGDTLLESEHSDLHRFLRHHYSDAMAIETAGKAFLSTALRYKREVLVVRAVRGVVGQSAVPGAKDIAARHAAAFALQVIYYLPPSPGSLPLDAERPATPEWLTPAQKQISLQRDELLARRKALAIGRPRADAKRAAEVDAQLTSIDRQIRKLDRQLRDGPGLKPGNRLGSRYTLVRLIGKGGVGAVWHAYDDVERKNVAIKVLHGHLSQDRTVRERFFRGASRMARLRHPHIVSVLDIGGESDGYHYFVMELLEGSLREAVAAGVPLEARRQLMIEVADALAYAHSAGCIHGDVKPENILIDAKVHAKLTDFDLVQVIAAATTVQTSIAASHGFTAPEAYQGGQAPTPQVDIYGLGMTGIHTFLDRPPTSAQLLRDPCDVIGRLAIPEPLMPVLARALALQPRDRYLNMVEMRDDLSRIQLSEPTPPTLPDQELRLLLQLAALDEADWTRVRNATSVPESEISPWGASPPRRARELVERAIFDEQTMAVLHSASSCPQEIQELPAAEDFSAADAAIHEDIELLHEAMLALDEDDFLNVVALLPEANRGISHSRQHVSVQQLILHCEVGGARENLVKKLRAVHSISATHGQPHWPNAARPAIIHTKLLLLVELIQHAPDGPASHAMQELEVLVRSRKYAQLRRDAANLALDLVHARRARSGPTLSVAMPLFFRMKRLIEELPEEWLDYEGDEEPPRTTRDLFPYYRVLCSMAARDFDAITSALCPHFLLPFSHCARSERVVDFLLYCDRWHMLSSLGTIYPIVECLSASPEFVTDASPSLDWLLDSAMELPGALKEELLLRLGLNFGLVNASAVWSTILTSAFQSKASISVFVALLDIQNYVAIEALPEKHQKLNLLQLRKALALLNKANFNELEIQLQIPSEYLIPSDQTLQRRIDRIFEFITLRNAEWIHGFVERLGRLLGIDDLRQNIFPQSEQTAEVMLNTTVSPATTSRLGEP